VIRPGTELDGAVRYPDLWGEEPAEALTGSVRAPLPDPEPELELVADPEPDLEPGPERPAAHAVVPFVPDPDPVVPDDDAVLPVGEQAVLDVDGAVEWRRPRAGTLLVRSSAENARPDTEGQAETAARLIEALQHFNVEAKVVGTVAGPHITRYELRLAPGVKMNKVAGMKDDLAYALAATDIRILAPIPGKQAVGVEVPILVAGTTGAGKSGCINAMLSSILLRATPEEVRLVLVDPKQVELNHYEEIPHLLTPVITSPRSAANALQNLVREMEWRYGIMSMARTRSLPELNKHRLGKGEKALPYILCVIDELADLMMVAPADVEDSIIRIAQKARAVGIHLVLATQSPRVDVITGMIKANVPSRIAFSVSSQTDSRVILDQNGAESLLGMGDMLFSAVGSARLHRIQGAYIDEGQIAALTEFWATQGEPELREDLLEEVEEVAAADDGGAGDDGFDPDEDPLLGDAIELVVEMGTASTSMLQRRGVISGYEGSKPRQVLVTPGDLPRVLAALAESAEDGPAAPSGDEATAILDLPPAEPDGPLPASVRDPAE
jgi:S-DNA-T family DNA segregation ATPase FtsK/SpoIIIE